MIRQEYATLTGRLVRMPEGTLRHPKVPFILAHVDGVTDDKRIFEAKTARSPDGWGKSGTDEVPHHYLVQVQHYLMVTGFKIADIAVLIGGNDFRVFEVPADGELQEMILEGERDFWRHVQEGQPPEPDLARPDALDIMRRLFPGTDGRSIIADEDDEHHRKVHQNAVETARQYQQLADASKAHLLHKMGSAARMIFPGDSLQLQRKQITRKQFVMPMSTYVDARFSKLRETTP